MVEERIWEIIGNQLKGEGSQEDARLLSDWLSEKPEHQALYDEALTVWKSTGQLNFKLEPNVDEEWEKFKMLRKNEVDISSNNDQIISESSEGKQISLTWFYRIAAIIVVGIGLTYFLIIPSQPDNDNMLTRNSGNEKTSITLHDGTVVWLNVNSTLTYPKDFDANKREVYLTGEAFFEVSPDANKPFVIYSGETEVEVLGTSFNVKGRQNTKNIEVAVITGKVSFSKKDKSQGTILEPGFKATFNVADDTFKKEQNSDANLLAWKENKLTFENMHVGNVISDLEDYFSIEIVPANDNIINCTYTGTYQDPELEDLLEVLCASLGLTYEMRDGRVVLSGDGCPHN
ncbi:FecR domain-containing protein [Fulvivirgaceae bacterium BMA10]|uniref:FecR domain-containing protein n=1 Tax=Splendidivirga corallicola TaxID=3051826 RepID=A0ABT8KUJ6_9BACT|nr:FecR domain-containing protein [Fulvivirgaceae bacterium BMA10]